MLKYLIVSAISLGLIVTIGKPAARAEPDDVHIITRGAEIINEKCAKCHSTSLSDKSSHAEAPPFREIVKRYPPETLAEALGEGITTGHPDMPLFLFEPEEINEIIAYLSSLVSPEN